MATKKTTPPAKSTKADTKSTSAKAAPSKAAASTEKATTQNHTSLANPLNKPTKPPTVTNTTTNTFSGFPRLKFLRARDAAVGNDFQGNAPRLQATAQIDYPLWGAGIQLLPLIIHVAT